MSEGNHHVHIQDFKVYAGVLVALLILTVVTVWVSNFDFGPWNDVIAIGVAGTKAALVIMFFMHGRFENKLIWAFIYYPLIILGTLLAALFIDYGNRDPNDFVVGDVMVQPAKHGKDHGAEGAHGKDADHSSQDESHGNDGDHQEPPAQGADDQSGNAPDATTPTEATEEGEQAPGGSESAALEAPENHASAWANLSGDAAAGKVHAKQICISCHIIDDKGHALAGAPAFEESANLARITPEYLRAWFKNPNAIKRGTAMPNLGLNSGEIENLIAFLATYKHA